MSIELRIPAVGESIQEVQIGKWLKREGERVSHDETIVELDTDKASMELPAPADGVIASILKHDGESVAVGDVIAYLDPDDGGGRKPAAETSHEASASAGHQNSAQEEKTQPVQHPPTPVKPDVPKSTPDSQHDEREPPAAPSVRRMLREHHVRPADVKPTGEGGRLLREDVLRYVEAHEPHPKADDDDRKADIEESVGNNRKEDDRSVLPADRQPTDEIVPMSLIRRRIAERLVEARQRAALLTTFNEIDMTSVIGLRTAYRDSFQKRFGVKLGYVSFFVKAAVQALREFPAVNAEVRGTDIVYHHHYDVGVAIGSGRGLVVPVLRDADQRTFAEIEQAIDDLARRAETNKLEPAELAGGTFTISNGGIYGSLLSTPIVNLPQSGVLGMHAIEERPVARSGQVVIRPMMYVALSYDHRIIDGREAVLFLKRIKETVEEPSRLLIGV